MKEVVNLSETEFALLSMWLQFAYESNKKGKRTGLWCGGLSALEIAHAVLRGKKLIKGNGDIYKGKEYNVI